MKEMQCANCAHLHTWVRSKLVSHTHVCLLHGRWRFSNCLLDSVLMLILKQQHSVIYGLHTLLTIIAGYNQLDVHRAPLVLQMSVHVLVQSFLAAENENVWTLFLHLFVYEFNLSSSIIISMCGRNKKKRIFKKENYKFEWILEILQWAGCHPAFTLWQLGQAPADPRDPELRNKRIRNMNEWLLEITSLLCWSRSRSSSSFSFCWILGHLHNKHEVIQQKFWQSA